MERVMDKAEATAEKPKQGKQLGKQLIGLVVAGLFLYFAFKDCDFNKLLGYIQQLDLGFLALVCLAGLISHVLRAIRWVILMSPLSTRGVSIWNAFCAVMYGYAVNLVIPRGGEVARIVAISKSDNIPWAGVLPTMFIDRLLDVAMLVMLLGITITVLPLGELNAPWLAPAGLSLCVATVAGLIALPFTGKIIRAVTALPVVQSKLPPHIMEKVAELSQQFDLGTKSLTNWVNLPAIAFLSFGIWTCYWLNLYLMAIAFHLGSVLDIAKSLVVFTIGSVGVLVPTPGSVGSYHLLVSQGMQSMIHIDKDQALAFATVLHFICFVVVICIPAAICFGVQSSRRVR
jgi:glycosyltransferase 2 family protein